MLDKFLDRLETRFRVFIYSELFKLYGENLKREIAVYLYEYAAYRQVLESWYEKDCKKNNKNRFENDLIFVMKNYVSISYGYWGLDVSLANPDEYYEEYNTYANLIYCIKDNDILYALLHYNKEVEQIKINIDNYFEELCG